MREATRGFSFNQRLLAAAALLFVEVFAFCKFTLLADVERRDRTMVAHHAGPDFAFCAFFVFQFDVCVFNIFIHCSLLCE